MLSSIVLQANETLYKPMPKGTRKADRMVDYYVFDVGIIREQLILREPSEPEPLVITDDEHTIQITSKRYLHLLVIDSLYRLADKNPPSPHRLLEWLGASGCL